MGYDLFALDPVILSANESTLVRTGIGLELPTGWGAIIVNCHDNIRAGRITLSCESPIDGWTEILVPMIAINDKDRDPDSAINAIRKRVRYKDKIGSLILIPISPFTATMVEQGEQVVLVTKSNIIPFHTKVA